MARQIFGEFHSPPPDLNAGVRLGLAVSHYLAHLLDGELSFVTTPLQGATFQLDLPRGRRPR
jgi:K+-sensing histidine kinase KdpD